MKKPNSSHIDPNAVYELNRMPTCSVPVPRRNSSQQSHQPQNVRSADYNRYMDTYGTSDPTQRYFHVSWPSAPHMLWISTIPSPLAWPGRRTTERAGMSPRTVRHITFNALYKCSKKIIATSLTDFCFILVEWWNHFFWFIWCIFFIHGCLWHTGVPYQIYLLVNNLPGPGYTVYPWKSDTCDTYVSPTMERIEPMRKLHTTSKSIASLCHCIPGT